MESVVRGQSWMARDGSHRVDIVDVVADKRDEWAVRRDDGALSTMRGRQLRREYVLGEWIVEQLTPPGKWFFSKEGTWDIWGRRRRFSTKSDADAATLPPRTLGRASIYFPIPGSQMNLGGVPSRQRRDPGP